MEAKVIFDKLEHIGIYIVDRKSLVVYYENPLARQYTGVDRIGKPCYEAHGNDSMCSSCPLRSLNSVSVVDRSDYNMKFAVRYEEIMWENHEAYMIVVVRIADVSNFSDEEKTIRRMSNALKKSVNIYSEINAETMQYRKTSFQRNEGYNIDSEGYYEDAYQQLCEEEVHPDDLEEFKKVMAPDVLKRISYESNGVPENHVCFHLKKAKDRIMDIRIVFIRDEIPHYIVCLGKDVTEDVQIHKQAETMENILNHVSCGVAIYGLNEQGQAHVEYVNEGLARLAECSKEELMRGASNDPYFTITKEYHSVLDDAFKKIASGEKEVNLTYDATIDHHKHKWISIHLTSYQTEDDVQYVYGTFFDVTSDVTIQKEFQEKYEIEKRRSHDDQTILAYAVFDLQNDRTIEMERRAPFNKIETQFSLHDFCMDISKTIVSEKKREQFIEMFDSQNLLIKCANGISEQDLEYQRRLPDGKIIWVKSSFRVISSPKQNTIFLFYYCNDINLTKSLQFMTSFFVDEDYDMIGAVNLSDDSAIMLYGKNSSKRELGQQETLKEESYTAATEWFVENAVVPEERDFYRKNGFSERIKEKLSENPTYEFTVHIKNQNNEIRTKQIRYTRSGVDADSCFFSQIDITQTLLEEEKKQQRLQEAFDTAKQANEAKTTFLSRMSHDMRTPMNGVLGLATLMKEETNLDEIHKDLDQLELSGKYLLQLINDTLDVSKIESGKMELRLKPINSEQVFGNILQNAYMMAVEKGVQLIVNKPDIPHGQWVPVMADASRLEQIFMNIVSNAIKFTPEGGEVCVDFFTLSISEDEVVDRYIISDTGIGMSEEFLKHIYEPFAQEGRINTNRENGTGLGMSIVKQLVELMNGTIEIESKINEGTKITLVIHYPTCPKQDVSSEKEKVDLSILKNKRVLLCEDHPLNAQIAQRLLSRVGVEVELAENGKIGVDLFQRSKEGYYDLVLMDIRMPIMNGVEATKAIRALDRTDAREIAILAMTANAFDDDVKECHEAGMNGHIAKPIDVNVLYDTLASYIKK